MKRLKIMTTAMLLALATTACGAPGSAASTTAAQTEPTTTAISTTEDSDTASESGEAGSSEADGSVQAAETGGEGSNVLIAYYTFPETDGTDTDAGASRVVVDGTLYGNTEYLANLIQERTGGTMFSIETVQEYPGLHDPLVDQAAEELANDVRPELAAQIENPDDYDVIFLGYPNWWGDFPMPLYTFLETTDFSGKTIIPFNSHGGSRFSNTISTMQSLQPDAEVITDGYTISRNDVGNARSSMEEWLTGLGY